MNSIGNTQTDEILKAQVVATYAAAIISNMGRPVTMDEVRKIRTDVHHTFFPQSGGGHYENWVKNHDPALHYE